MAILMAFVIAVLIAIKKPELLRPKGSGLISIKLVPWRVNKMSHGTYSMLKRLIRMRPADIVKGLYEIIRELWRALRKFRERMKSNPVCLY